MVPSTQNSTAVSRAAAAFTRTHWSVVLAAPETSAPQSQEAFEALGKLCEAYWSPIYTFIRRREANPEEAKDLTQGFFARLLDKKYLQGITIEGGKFRSFLLTLLKHFLADVREREWAIKRGRGQTIVSIDEESGESGYQIEPAVEVTPEELFHVQWAQTVLEKALAKLRDAYAAKGNSKLFEELQSCLTGAEDQLRHAERGARLGMNENAVKQAVSRLRQAWRKLLNAEVATTVSSQNEIKSEIQELKALIARHARIFQVRAPNRPSN